MSKAPNTHTLDQDILFVATHVANNFEGVKISSKSLAFRKDGTELTYVGPHKMRIAQFN